MRKISCTIIVFLAIFFLSGCENRIETNDQTSLSSEETNSSSVPVSSFDLSEYKSLVLECRSTIKDASIYLTNMGTYEVSYWKHLGTLSDNMVDSAFKWLEEKSDNTRDNVESSDTIIREQYKKIILIETDGNEAKEINDAFRSMYDAYISIYSMVTSPSGTVTSFTTQLNEQIEKFKKADDALSLFLD